MKKPRDAGLFLYLPVGAGVRVEPLGEGLIWVLPDGFSPLARPAAALPASFDMPLFGAPVELPVVVPLTEDPAVVPVAAAPPAAEPPPAEPLPDCASAQLPVSPSAAANANVASFMIAPFLVRHRQRGSRALRSNILITVRCCSVEDFTGHHLQVAIPVGGGSCAESLFNCGKWLA